MVAVESSLVPSGQTQAQLLGAGVADAAAGSLTLKVAGSQLVQEAAVVPIAVKHVLGLVSAVNLTQTYVLSALVASKL